MKRLSTYLLVLSGLVYFASCSKEVSFESKGNTPGNNTPGDFRAKINGIQWQAAAATEGANILAGFINIVGISSDGKEISITVNDTITGTYLLNQTTFSVASYADNAASNTFSFSTDQGADTSQGGGSVIITEIDKTNKTISGTFRFNVYRDQDSSKKVVTEGVFYKLPYSSSLPPAAGTDTLKATIDGAAWSAASIAAQLAGTQLIIAGSLSDGSKTVSLFLPADILVGTYNLDVTAGIYVALYSPNTTTVYASDNGTVTITQHDTVNKRISGTFQFHAIDVSGGSSTSQLLNGYFSVTYQ